MSDSDIQDPEKRQDTLSEWCLKGHNLYQEGKYREAIKSYRLVEKELTQEELADNWIVIKQLGMCEYKLNHRKQAYKIWMSLEQNPVDLFVFVTEKLQSESTLLLPELMDLFPKYRFLYYISADRLLKVENLEMLESRVEKCPHPFDQWFLKGINSLFFTTSRDKNNYLDRWRELLNKMVQYTHHDFQTQRDLMEMCFTSLFHFHPSYFEEFSVIDAQNWSGVVRKIYPSVDYISSQSVARSDNSNNKIKIGFVNCFANRLHSVTRDRAGIIVNIDENRFDKHLIYLDGPVQDIDLVKGLMSSISKENHHKIIPEEFLFQPQNVIERLDKCNFDILVYCELGMNPISYFLAHSRLAPIQITTWGHSVTSGISTIDYYITSKWFEPEENQKFYSEKLVRMNSLTTYYPTITIPNDNQDFNIRNRLKIPQDGKIVGCMQSYFKLQPEWFETIANLLSQDKDIILLLQIPKSSENQGGSGFEKKYKNRLKTLLDENISQIRFLESMDYRSYLQVLSQCDIMIDPFPFGGCNTSLEAFRLGKIVITLPGKKLPGRFTQGFYQKMNISTTRNPIVCSSSEYIETTLFYLNNKENKEYLESQIKEKCQILFLEQDSITEWEDTLTKLFNDYDNTRKGNSNNTTSNNTIDISKLQHTDNSIKIEIEKSNSILDTNKESQLITSLKENNVELEGRIESLQEENCDLVSLNESLQEENKNLESHNKSLQDENSRFQNTIESENSDFEIRIESLQSENSRLEKRVESLQSENSEFESRIKSLQSEKSELENRIESLQGENNTQRDNFSVDNLNDLKKENETLREKVKTLKKKLKAQ